MTAVTADGHKIKITAHIESPQQLDLAGKHGADGIGFINACPFGPGSSPSEQEEKNLDLFLEAGRAAGQKTVTVLLADPDEGSPDGGTGPPGDAGGQGLRGLRRCLEQPEAYRPQLRALLRAGHQGRYELALPMVGDINEIVRFKGMLGEIKAQLEEEGTPHCSPAVGIMVQVPGVIPVMDKMVYESGFFIVDDYFLKYLLADQRLPRGEDDYLSFYHHAFLLQAQVVGESIMRREAGARICGPLVRDPAAIPVLIGLNFNEIIAPPQLIPGIKEIVGYVDRPAARLVAAKIMSYSSPERAREYAWERLMKFRHQ